MDDLIVIILTLVFAAAGIFGQMKKKQAAGQAENQPEPPADSEPEGPGNFWDFLDAEPEYMQQAPVAGTPQQEQQVQAAEKKPVAVKKPVPKIIAENEDSSIYSNDLTSDGKVEKTKKDFSKERFPLRKAVIYSEILNRKYT
ncbi:MAG: hypothetical protein ACOCU7_03775 [Tangfeifania sp.]